MQFAIAFCNFDIFSVCCDRVKSGIYIVNLKVHHDKNLWEERGLTEADFDFDEPWTDSHWMVYNANFRAEDCDGKGPIAGVLLDNIGEIVFLTEEDRIGSKEDKWAAPRAAWHRLFPEAKSCLLYTSPSPRDLSTSRMPSSA